jgi:hypothetical protein
MNIHILDWVIWLVLCGIIWKILEWSTDGEWTEELGGIIGLFILVVFTIIHIFLFGVLDWNWIDIFHKIGSGWRPPNINW